MAIDSTVPRSRRAILLGALGVTAATVASAVGRTSTVNAYDDQPVLVGNTYGASHATEILATGATAYFGKSDSQVGVSGASDSGVGVAGLGNSGPGVSGHTNSGASGVVGVGNNGHSGIAGFSRNGGDPLPATPTSTGVYGWSDVDSGPGVVGHSVSWVGVWGQSNDNIAVYGTSDTSVGMRGVSNLNTGVWGSSGSATGVVGSCGGDTSAPAHTGVFGYASNGGTGVFGQGAGGRGGQFSGKRAQLRLIPSSASSHPGRGAQGDLFVDSSGRLWLCKGAATWVLLG